jgi:hypothetical protein
MRLKGVFAAATTSFEPATGGVDGVGLSGGSTSVTGMPPRSSAA